MTGISQVFPDDLRRWAFFLDVDGTLIDLADTPDGVIMPPKLPHQIADLSARLDGALALVSGRSIQSVDTLFRPYRFPVAGLHGNEMRHEMDGSVSRTPVDEHRLDNAKRSFEGIVAKWPGVILEDKGAALAIHYRQAPAAFAEIDVCVTQLFLKLGPHWTRQDGKMVVEIRPSGANKGSALAKFMRSPPFAKRLPLAIGDDLTDEAMFKVANTLSGQSILVGSPGHVSQARSRVESPAMVQAWLGQATHAGENRPGRDEK
ncbi:trehalose-phosphatase [Phyllobacterium myrsinacearum]|uniref:Trehalose 6-phosphate phosphatase n=1 Tax=Phyllobacterium myrsinacearum TaxID=28101 RepID=A0A839ELB0_9HYPH|nr:trehalose-phosphatase [Phyllobacterium myrsinacearum]MBA8879652.1 trehalose 6-phosphate phosphatase [Phyllobacterium myrsinacearum]